MLLLLIIVIRLLQFSINFFKYYTIVVRVAIMYVLECCAVDWKIEYKISVAEMKMLKRMKLGGGARRLSPQKYS